MLLTYLCEVVSTHKPAVYKVVPKK